MFEKSIYQLFWPKTILGVNWYIDTEGNENIRVANIGLTKEKLNFIDEPKTVEKLEQLVELYPKTPIALTLSGKGILQKVVETTEEDSDEYVLGEVLPNAKIKEFYIQRSKIGDNKQFVAVVRKSQLNNVLEELKKEGLSTIGVFLGIIPVLEASHLFSGNDNIQTDGFSLSLDDNCNVKNVSNVSSSDNTEYKIGSEKIKLSMLSAFSGAVNLLLKMETDLENDQVIAEKENFIYNTTTRKTALFSGILFLVVLLVNFLFFQHYYKQSDGLKSQASLYSQSVKELNATKSQYDSSRVFLSQAGWLKPNNASFYLDRLAEEIPDGMMFKQVNLYPKKTNKITERRAYNFNTQIVYVKGEVDKNSILTKWMETLNNRDWIASSKLINLEQEFENKTGYFELEIELN